MADNRFVQAILQTAQVTTVSLPWARTAKIVVADDANHSEPAGKITNPSVAAQ
ncbi:MAG: hypothetical protein P8Q92_12120 [Pseudoprimorskyibacter sp.]|nr:hypothetical protein [Pseudoprimorskyibacter sp.]